MKIKVVLALAASVLGLSGVLTAAVPSYETLISHRGESLDAPENTLPACKMAVDRGFGFECDVYYSKDGRVVTFHDGRLTRTTNGANTNRCCDVLWSELSKVDVGNWGKWKGSKYAGTRPALLEEILDLARDGRWIYVEVKPGPEIVPHIKRVFAAQKKATPANTLFISFNPESCKALKAQMPDYKTIWIVSPARTPYTDVKTLIAKLKELGVDGVDCHYSPSIVTADYVKAVKDAGFEFHVWTVDDLNHTREMFRRGVQTVTTNCAKKLLDEHTAQPIEISPAKPLGASRQSEREAYRRFIEGWRSEPRRLFSAFAAAATYPGLPAPGTTRVTRKVKVDLSIPRWHSTGLFAAAGEPLRITLPKGAEKSGLRVRVGATHCSLLRKGEWRRPPVVCTEFELNRRVTVFSSPFGGPVYIVAPFGAKGKVAVSIGPACPAPHFVEGRDTPETWAKQLRETPAPFVELENDRIVLTVPYEAAKKLVDPRPLLQVWREIVDNSARLVGRPINRAYPERICVDPQLCAGYMHAGYPIMVPSCSAGNLIDEPGIRTGRKDDVWGFFHEMGHNHQSDDWTFNGTVEVTVNFFSLYNREKICGRKVRDNHKIGTPYLRAKVKKWNEAGRPLREWYADPFLALDFFAGLIEKYGWESFEKLFAEYRALPPGEKPKSDLDKRRQWCQRLSRIVGEDLTREFEFLMK